MCYYSFRCIRFSRVDSLTHRTVNYSRQKPHTHSAVGCNWQFNLYFNWIQIPRLHRQVDRHELIWRNDGRLLPYSIVLVPFGKRREMCVLLKQQKSVLTCQMCWLQCDWFLFTISVCGFSFSVCCLPFFVLFYTISSLAAAVLKRDGGGSDGDVKEKAKCFDCLWLTVPPRIASPRLA